MSTEHTRYDIFVSYAHADDVGGWVQALCKRIEQDQLSFSRERLEIFHDRKIRSMDDWEHRILGALRHSRVLLVCLSPAYFASKYCKGEWEEYVRRQVPRPGGPGSIAGVYFVEVPGEGTSEDPWHRAAFVPQLTDVRPWFPDGAAAMANEVVAGRLRELGMSLWERIQRAHRADLPAGNIRRQTPYFVGRTEEMRRLHQQVSKNAVGLLAAVHGIGGQGKTELAVAYAHSFADQYPAGLWWLGAEGKTQLLPLLAELAFAPELGYQPSEIERKDPALLGRGVIAELGRRARAAHERDPNGGSAALVVLDNVSEPALLSSVQLASLPRADWLRLIATTRLGPDSLHAPASALGFVTVDSLDVDDALALMREHQPARDPAGLMPAFVSAAETAAARELAQELGGLTLAVEQVAVHLGLHPEVTPSALLAALREKGLTSVDRLGGREAVADQILHEEKRMAIVLEETLGALDAPTRIALGFAALLPPDVVPWAWLKSLTLIHHPELDQVVPDEPDPWLVVRRRLEGLRLITSGAILEVGRIHRVIAAHVAEGADRARLRPQLLAYLAGRTRAMSQASALTDEWNLDALLTTLPFELVRGDEAHISGTKGPSAATKGPSAETWRAPPYISP